MTEIEKKIAEAREELIAYTYEDNHLNYIGARLKKIRLELKKKNKIFQIQHLAQITNLHKLTISKIESGENSGTVKNVMLLINIYRLHGYNPLWILTRENMFVEKKETNNNQLVLNASTVEVSVNNLVKEIEKAKEILSESMDEFQRSLK